MSTLAAWADGSAPSDASLSFALAGTGKPAPLRDLMEVPMSAWQHLGGHLLGSAVNAKALSRSSEDAAAKNSLQLISTSPGSPQLVSAVDRTYEQAYAVRCTVCTRQQAAHVAHLYVFTSRAGRIWKSSLLSVHAEAQVLIISRNSAGSLLLGLGRQ